MLWIVERSRGAPERCASDNTYSHVERSFLLQITRELGPSEVIFIAHILGDDLFGRYLVFLENGLVQSTTAFERELALIVLFRAAPGPFLAHPSISELISVVASDKVLAEFRNRIDQRTEHDWYALRDRERHIHTRQPKKRESGKPKPENVDEASPIRTIHPRQELYAPIVRPSTPPRPTPVTTSRVVREGRFLLRWLEANSGEGNFFSAEKISQSLLHEELEIALEAGWLHATEDGYLFDKEEDMSNMTLDEAKSLIKKLPEGVRELAIKAIRDTNGMGCLYKSSYPDLSILDPLFTHDVIYKMGNGSYRCKDDWARCTRLVKKLTDEEFQSLSDELTKSQDRNLANDVTQSAPIWDLYIDPENYYDMRKYTDGQLWDICRTHIKKLSALGQEALRSQITTFCRLRAEGNLEDGVPAEETEAVGTQITDEIVRDDSTGAEIVAAPSDTPVMSDAQEPEVSDESEEPTKEAVPVTPDQGYDTLMLDVVVGHLVYREEKVELTGRDLLSLILSGRVHKGAAVSVYLELTSTVFGLGYVDMAEIKLEL